MPLRVGTSELLLKRSGSPCVAGILLSLDVGSAVYLTMMVFLIVPVYQSFFGAVWWSGTKKKVVVAMPKKEDAEQQHPDW